MNSPTSKIQTISAFSLACGHDRRTVERRVLKYKISPQETDGRARYFAIEDLERIMAIDESSRDGDRASRPKLRLDFGDGAEAVLGRVGDNLIDDLKAALLTAGIKSTSRKIDRAAVALFNTIAGHADHIATSWGFPSVKEPCSDDEGSIFPPQAIVEAAARSKQN